MRYCLRIEVWGDYASFNRPEMKVERVSYDVMTPSAVCPWHTGGHILASGVAVADRPYICPRTYPFQQYTAQRSKGQA